MNQKKGPLNLPKTYLRSMRELPKYKWFKPLLAIVLFGVLYFTFVVLLAVIQEFFGYDALGLREAADIAANSDNYLREDLTDPLQVFFLSASVGVMIPAAGLAAKITGLGGMRSLSSVENRFRWKNVAKLALPIFGVTAIFTVVIPIVSMIINGGTSELASAQFAPLGLIAILVFVPFQCAGEEYAFRGLIQKVLGSWIPVPVVVIIIQSIAFAVMHGYDLLGNFGIMITGIIWGWLAIKTGGLEATTVLHSANNVTAMMMSIIFTSTTVTVSTSIEGFILDLASTLIAAAVAYWLCKKNGYILEDKAE